MRPPLLALHAVTPRPLGPHALTSAVAAVLPVAHQTSATGSAAPWLLTITRGQAFGVVFWTFAFLRWGPRVIHAIIDLVPRAHAAWARFIAQQSPYASAFARPMPKPAGSMAEAFADLGQALQGATSAAIDAASNEIFGRSLSRWADLSDDGLAEVFTEIDADNSGNITFEEMQAAVVSAHVSDTGDGRTPYDEETFNRMVSAIKQWMKDGDADADGTLDLDEFMAIIRSSRV